ncbi:lysoplasmalogenase [Alteromonas sp. MTD1]|uniref:lysoplasmalogenase n=1 Tax=Alteromonas sp. MTD1 TaxID=3057962 RepID=UPI0036F43E13
MKKRIAVVYAVLSSIYLASLLFSPYAYQFVLKALPVALLTLAVVKSTSGMARVVLAFALIFSLAGDVVLALPIEHSFLAGLACFFLAHVTYVLSFYCLTKRADHLQHTNAFSPLAKGLISLYVLIFALLMAMHILPEANTLFFPVLAYISVILTMGLSAIWLSNTRLIVGGALLFIVSDAVLAQSVFRTPLPFSPFLVMLTYYAAQYCLAVGLMAAFNPKSEKLAA